METRENKRIIELSKNVADKIAAGEVVDRPVSVVKELVENSIDAGASSVIVEIRNGGKSYIRVTDNGSGIEKEDVDLAFKRHATSKIRSAADLDHIGSLGFRGEALASIAAVSRVELITKTTADKSGMRIKIEGGEVLEKEDTGCPEGTTIIIEDLFFNTPARLKFMKPDSTESTLIIDLISKMTLAYPQIRMRLINNGNILFSTAGKGDIHSNILTIYSREIGDKLIHLQEENGPMALEAFISAPDNSKTNRKSQIFFVNGRYINSKLMESAVSDGYLEKLFEGRYPIAFLFLQVAPEKLDVNIHPNKREVRFDEERLVKDFIVESIRKGLKTKEAIPEIKEKNLFQFKQSDSGSATSAVLRESAPETEAKAEIPAPGIETKIEIPAPKQRVEEQVNIKKLLFEQRKQEKESEQKIESEPEEVKEPEGRYRPSDETHRPLEKAHTPHEFAIEDLTVTGSIFGTYITAADENSFYLIDQHAAHERIFYEQLLAQYQKEEKAQQMILTPIVINVTHAIKNNMEGMLDFLGNMGFQAEEFGPAAYIIKAIPVFMELDEASDFIDYILDNISEEGDLKNQKKIDSIITNACKKAVKAHDVLDMQEIERLMADLAKTKNPYSCPHGRPTFVRMRKYEIEKMFKRV
ncbi:MAG TPA: DNA mismatch repair endonuclease MutL [Bacillota bacterium]|nr:DNA mismatch repair endonuclease MutL [Bacillota bacterium]